MNPSNTSSRSSHTSPSFPSNGNAGRGTRQGRGRGRGGGEGRGNGARKGSRTRNPVESYSTLGKLVTQATKPSRDTGYRNLDEDVVRRIKAIARQDERCATGAREYLMQRMAAKNSEVRYMALSVLEQLFTRSKTVRGAVASDLQAFMHMTVGHDIRQPLPAPPGAAEALRQKALGLLEEWNDVYGGIYKGLRAAYRFLKEAKRMRFPEVQGRAMREAEEEARREDRTQRLLRAKYAQAKGEMAHQISELTALLQEMGECFAILMPGIPGVPTALADPVRPSGVLGKGRGHDDNHEQGSEARIGGAGGPVGVGNGDVWCGSDKRNQAGDRDSDRIVGIAAGDMGDVGEGRVGACRPEDPRSGDGRDDDEGVEWEE
ncbi:unnamed protein product, partial [Discosporangium mesarthrocarpum]